MLLWLVVLGLPMHSLGFSGVVSGIRLWDNAIAYDLWRLPMHSLGFSVLSGAVLRSVTVVDLWQDGKCAFNMRRKNALRDLKMSGKINQLRNRIKSVGNTKKITEAMRLVSAAKVENGCMRC